MACHDAKMPLFKESAVFACDLMAYMMEVNGCEYVCLLGERYRRKVPCRFKPNMRVALRYLEYALFVDISAKYQALFTSGIVDIMGFEGFAEEEITEAFASGYTASAFLVLCVRLASTAIFFHNYGVKTTPNKAVEILADVASRYFDRKLWKELENETLKYVNLYYEVEEE